MKDKYKIAFFTLLGILIGITLTLATLTIINNTKSKTDELTLENGKEKSVDKKGKNETKLTEDEGNINKSLNNNDNYKISSQMTSTTINDNKANNQVINTNSSDNNQTINKSDSNYTITNDYSNKEDSKNSTDNEILNYLEAKKDEISSKIKDGTYKEKAKNGFIEVVDFLFYNGTIKGHTFDELTGKVKLEAIKIAIKIEDKIEEYQPGLIDSLSGKYSNIKTKIINLYTSKINEYCNSNPSLCSEVKSDYKKIKNSFKNAFNNVKSKASNFYQEKIKSSN